MNLMVMGVVCVLLTALFVFKAIRAEQWVSFSGHRYGGHKYGKVVWIFAALASGVIAFMSFRMGVQ